jgi:hypothetical protein
MPPQDRKPTNGHTDVLRVDNDLAATIGAILQFVPKIDYVKVKVKPAIDKRLAGDLKDLLDLPPTLSSAATRLQDGRLVKLVLVTIHNRAGQSRPGIPVQLLDENDLVIDRAFTSRTGFAILTFPRPHLDPTAPPPAPADTKGKLRILDGTAAGRVEAVTIPVGEQFVDITLMLATLPVLPVDTSAAADLLWPWPGVGDDPLTNLPADFTPELCDAVAAKAGDEGDSLLGKVGDPDDFRSRRTPLIKRLSVVRNGEETVSANSKEPRRFLVRLRQSWLFLGYTLGELAEVEALDPGEIVDEAVATVERSVEQVSRLVDQAKSFATSNVLDTLSETNKIDTLVQAATSTSVSASVSGWGFGIPGFGIGSLGARAGVRTNATTSTDIDTSLHVNHAISTAQTMVNEAIHSTTSTLTSLARTISSKVAKVSPLLSRVTNLLRWRVYENYAVCTHVEDVLELVSFEVLDIPAADMPKNGKVTKAVFSPEEIVEYRRFFEPSLLEPRLRGEYPALVDAVRVGPGGRPINHLTVEVAYSASYATGHLTIDVNGAVAELRLRPGGTRATATVRFGQPVPAAAITAATLTLTASPQIPDGLLSFFKDAFDKLVSVDVTSVTIWAGVEPGLPPTLTQSLGSDLHLDGSGGSRQDTISFTVPPPLVDATANPLWLHVNLNPSYYLGVLAQAALLFPSLREDSDKLSAIPADVWRLPIVGFEGNHIVVLKNADPTSKDVVKLLGDPGAATLVQIAAPGAYSEALQGLLSLADAEGLIHPSLIPAPAPVMPPLSIVDLTGKQLVPVAANGSGPLPVPPGPVPPAPVPPVPAVPIGP